MKGRFLMSVGFVWIGKGIATGGVLHPSLLLIYFEHLRSSEKTLQK